MRYYVLGVTLLVLALSLVYDRRFRGPSSVVAQPRSHYDYIVVGGGTAGCVLASRLSEASNATVLLVEAGGHVDRWWSRVPLAAPLLQLTDVDWAYKTEPQLYSSWGYRERKQSWPRGRALGGSGQLNYLMHSYGLPGDYERWPRGWSFDALRPYFERVSRAMSVAAHEAEEPLSRAFIDATRELLTLDGATYRNLSVGRPSMTVSRGGRWTSYDGYLRRAWHRRNLDILPDTLATQILFEGRRANGIAVTSRRGGGYSGKVAARREIILSAGTVNTPQLLMLSGLGPSDELAKHRIRALTDLPDVGRNLLDHMNLPIYVNVGAPVSPTLTDVRAIPELYKYLLHGTGRLASNGIVGTAVYNGSGLMLFGIATADEKLLKDVANYRTETFRKLFPSHNDSSHRGFLYLASCLQPRSRGRVILKSRNARDHPRIDPAYLASNEDVSCMQRAVGLAVATLGTKPFLAYGARLHAPELGECIQFPRDYRHRGYTECLIRVAALTSYHPIGSCRMGTDDRAVVDENLRVRGVRRLRIMDGSILPTPISGPPNSVIVAMAERAVDLILERPSPGRLGKR